MSFETPSPDTAPPVAESRLRGTMLERSRTSEKKSRVVSSVGRAALRGTLLPPTETLHHKSAPKTTEAKASVAADARAISTRITGRTESGPLAITHVKERLNSASIRALYDKYGSFKTILGGSIPEFIQKNTVDLAAARKGRGYDSATHGKIPYRNGMSKAWETGVDVGKLVETRPNDRFKFYLSLDTSTPQKQARAIEFLQKVHESAAEQGLSMLTKTEDHTYDNCDLYTWEPEQMATTLSGLYQEYPDIWLDTEHPLQGDIYGVDPMHIGFVQEPIGGVKGNSHSTRMGKLGEALDAGASFEDACASASVMPEAPWLVAPAALAS